MRLLNTICLVPLSICLLCGMSRVAYSQLDEEGLQLSRDIERHKAESKRIDSQKAHLEKKEQQLQQEDNQLQADSNAIEQMKANYRRNPSEAYRAQINARVAAYNDKLDFARQLQSELQRRRANYNHDVEAFNERRAVLVKAAERYDRLQQERKTAATKASSGNGTEYTQPQPTSTATSTTPRGPRLGFDENVPRRVAK